MPSPKFGKAGFFLLALVFFVLYTKVENGMTATIEWTRTPTSVRRLSYTRSGSPGRTIAQSPRGRRETVVGPSAFIDLPAVRRTSFFIDLTRTRRGDADLISSSTSQSGSSIRRIRALSPLRCEFAMRALCLFSFWITSLGIHLTTRATARETALSSTRPYRGDLHIPARLHDHAEFAGRECACGTPSAV